MVQGDVISGRVVDEDAEPLSRVQLQALQLRYVQGRRRAVPLGWAMSDDRGEYRIFGVSPGKVYVRATLQTRGGPEEIDSSSPSETTSYPPILYPNVLDAGHASPLTVRGGEELHVDFTMTPQRSYSVSGRVVGGAQGKPTWLTLTKRGENELAFGPGMNTTMGEDNTFTFKQVLPGSYLLMAQQQDEKLSATGTVEAEVWKGDVLGLVVALLPIVDVNGHIRFEGGGSSARPTDVGIALLAEGREDFKGGSYAQPKADGTFTLHTAADVRYRIEAYSAPPEMYLSSATAGQDDVLEKGFSAASGRALDLVFAVGGKLSGTITTADQPEPGVTVILAPEQNLAGLAESFRTATTDRTEGTRFRVFVRAAIVFMPLSISTRAPMRTRSGCAASTIRPALSDSPKRLSKR